MNVCVYIYIYLKTRLDYILVITHHYDQETWSSYNWLIRILLVGWIIVMLIMLNNLSQANGLRLLVLPSSSHTRTHLVQPTVKNLDGC